MKKLTLSALDSLFYFLNKPSITFWLRDKKYNRQLYVSPSFESIWGRSCVSLYEDPLSFRDSVLPDENGKLLLSLDFEREKAGQDEKQNELLAPDELFWQIKTPQGEIRHVMDSPFILVGNDGNPVAFGGVGASLSQEEWHNQFYLKKQHPLTCSDPLKKHIFDVLKKEMGLADTPKHQDAYAPKEMPLYYVIYNKKTVIFTAKESQCLYYLLQGKSAKQTAALLSLSQRTVEFHLNNAKAKAACRTKLELLSKVQQWNKNAF
jgi:DNA-binding CsgD family transcriptional regulator